MASSKPIFKKNETKSKVNYNKLKDIVLLSEKFEPIETTTRKATILASNVAMEVKGVSGAYDYNEDTLKQIYNMQLPAYMAWDYWVFLTQWVDYWINRYKIVCKDRELMFCLNSALRNAITFGSGVIAKQQDKFIAGGLIERELNFNGQTIKGKIIPAYLSLSYGSVSVSNTEMNKPLKFDKKTEEKAINADAIDNQAMSILDWRYNRIGDFVWCMKDLLIDMFFKKTIETNNSNLLNKLGVVVKNAETLPIELAIIRNPFLPYFIKISDEQSESKGENKFETFNNGDKGGSHINSLIECLKHHQEYYYAKFGRPISSNKQQSLSSDASLSVMSQEAIAQEHDTRVRLWLEDISEKFGVPISLDIDEPETEPENENADKEGEGKEKTEGAENKEKAKVEG